MGCNLEKQPHRPRRYNVQQSCAQTQWGLRRGGGGRFGKVNRGGSVPNQGVYLGLGSCVSTVLLIIYRPDNPEIALTIANFQLWMFLTSVVVVLHSLGVLDTQATKTT